MIDQPQKNQAGPNGQGLLFLISRPVAEYREAALAAGWGDCHFEAPLEFEFLDQTASDWAGCEGILFSSQTAVESVATLGLVGKKAWVIGAATAMAATKAGFEVMGVVEGGGAKFADAVLAGTLAPPKSGLIWASVDQPAFDLVSALLSAGIRLDQRVTYRSVIKAEPSESLLQWAGEHPNADVALFSVQCAKAFEAWAKAYPNYFQPRTILMIGPRVRQGLSAETLEKSQIIWPETASRESFAKILCNFSYPGHMLSESPSI